MTTSANHSRTAYAALAFIHLALIMPIGFVLKGWALSTLWGWFIVPVFQAPALSIPAAIGANLIAAFLTKQVMPEDQSKKPDERLVQSIGYVLLAPPVFVLVGWIVKQWMPA